MAWSYRPDEADQVLAGGPANVSGKPTIYTAAGAINPAAGLVILSGSGTAMTLVAPTVQGQLLEIISDAATAFVVTPTGGINNGVTGGVKTAATFAAFKGASITLRGVNGVWAAQNLLNVTVA